MNGRYIQGKLLPIDERSNKIGGSWQGWKDGCPEQGDLETLEFFYGLIKDLKNPVIMDIGANTGGYSLLATLIKDLKVFAFEPVPITHEVLKSNIQLNDVEDRVQSFQIALSNVIGKTVVHLPSSGYESGLACLGTPHRFKDWKDFEVPMTTLDAFTEDQKIDRVDFLKIDIEGSELFVLQGGEKFIKKCRPSIFLEYLGFNLVQSGCRTEQIDELLYSWGYKKTWCGHSDVLFKI